MLYKMSLQGDFEEDHLEKAMQQTMTALQTAQTPEKEIMHSLLAQLIQQYYNQNKWNILQRTAINDQVSEDIQTWDAMQFEQAIRTHYLLSLEHRKQLEALPLKDFQAIITKYDTNFWPTMYDLLANRALLFFTDLKTPTLRTHILLLVCPLMPISWDKTTLWFLNYFSVCWPFILPRITPGHSSISISDD